ncbi:MAG TPA: lanthionine synthetase LanC family protein [Candidatus Elarobacter sp.]|nr:lanthionine synthetase LanC family protein [Candidatus Elarobacter sp.]
MREIAATIAQRVAEPDDVVNAMHSFDEKNATHRSRIWTPAGLADGLSGAILLLGALEGLTGDRKYTRALFKHARAAMEVYEQDSSLYGGWAGLAGALLMTNLDGRFADALRVLAARLGDAMLAQTREPFALPHSVNDYDLMLGYAGRAIPIGLHDRRVAGQLCEYLAWLLDDPASRMRVQPPDMSQPLSVYFGAAHGVAGVLGALVILSGTMYRSTIMNALAFLESSVIERADGPTWLHTDTASPFSRNMVAWCHGPIGIAAVVEATCRHIGPDADRYTKLVKRTLESALHGPSKPRVIDGGLCHGRAGIALLIAGLSHVSPGAAAVAGGLGRSLLDSYDPAVRFGYLKAGAGDKPVDGYDFLSGAIGIALALLTLSGQCDAAWVQLLGVPL